MSIDLKDFIRKQRRNGKKIDKIYHLYCDSCGKSRGYNAKYLSIGYCNPCASIKRMTNISPEHRSEIGRYAVSCVKNHTFTEERKKKISKANTGKIRSLEVRIADSARKQGIPISKWKDFIYNTDDPKRQKYKFERICQQIYQRDDYTCKACCKRGGKLHAHHLDNWAKFKEKRYDFNNIVCLCFDCHMAFHSKYGKKHNTKEQFLTFIKE